MSDNSNKKRSIDASEAESTRPVSRVKKLKQYTKQQNEFVADAVADIKEARRQLHNSKVRYVKEILEALEVARRAASELRAIREEPTLFDSEKVVEHAFTGLEQHFPIADVPNAVKRRHRDIFPSSGWSRDEASPEEKAAFAEKDRKVIERFTADRLAQARAYNTMRLAAVTGEQPFTQEEYKQFTLAKEAIKFALDNTSFPSSADFGAFADDL